MVEVSNIIERLPSIIPRDPRTTIVQYISAFNDDTESLEERLNDVRNSHYVDLASGGNTATGTVNFEVLEDAATEIPEGTVVKTPSGVKFETVEEVTVSQEGGTFWGNDWESMRWSSGAASSTITVSVDIVSVNAGTRYNVDANTITVLEEDILGVQSVTNPTATSGGIITELDEIGRMFGPVGGRGGRDDDEYRKYLKSIVDVFRYRGTIPGIKASVSTAVGVEDNDVEVYEHFNDDPVNDEEYLEYTVRLYDWDDHRGTTVEETSQLADASMSRLRKVSYRFPESVGVGETIQISQGTNITDISGSNDTISIDGDATTVSDQQGSTDAVATNANTTTVADGAGVSDAVSVSVESANYDSGTFDESYWSE